MTRLAERAEPRRPAWQTLARILLVFVLLYGFLGGMAMMGEGLKALGKNPHFDASQPQADGNQPYRPVVYQVFSHAANPLVGLFVGILVTAIFQSSSFTAAFVVSLVVTTPLTLHQAIFIIMGVNIGTCITNAGVSFMQMRRAEEFERAYGAAITHEIFNTLTVLILFPIEWIVWKATGRGFLERIASALASGFYSGTPTGHKPTNFLKEAVEPLTSGTSWILDRGLGLSHNWANVALAALGVVLLFVALIGVTKALRNLVLKRVERLFDRVLFRNDLTAFLVGLVLTGTVQCSSITTSLVVPLVAAGLLNIFQVFLFTLGANVGTTVTALLASFAASADTPQLAKVGIALAFSHTAFNVLGVAVWYPLRRVPIGIARWHARQAARSKRYAVFHVVGFFFGLPLLILSLCWLLE
ncbi:MAG: Na/Pi symporter [Phycisphaerae bacterium]|nr:Na/Pi symporter [Phycisphaerae bacterium]